MKHITIRACEHNYFINKFFLGTVFWNVTCFILISCLAYSSTLKMEATYSSETSADFQRTTLLYIPNARILHNHPYENLKYYFF
jgi:hypothetical protein